MENPKSRIKAFRLNMEVVVGIRTAAKRQAVSENALVQGVLAQRVKADPFIHAFPYVVLSRESFAPILAATNPDSLEVTGFDLGRRNFSLMRELYQSAGAELSFTQYLKEVLDEQAHWFVVEGMNIKPERLTLRHGFGIKWSLFLRSFLTGAYEVLSREKIRTGVTDVYVSLETPKTQR